MTVQDCAYSTTIENLLKNFQQCPKILENVFKSAECLKYTKFKVNLKLEKRNIDARLKLAYTMCKGNLWPKLLIKKQTK